MLDRLVLPVLSLYSHATLLSQPIIWLMQGEPPA